MSAHICNYCGRPRKDLEGWHGCEESLAAKKRIDEDIEHVQRSAKTKEKP